MISTYRINKKFTSSELREILKEVNLPIRSKYENSKTIASELTNYKGELDVNSIIAYIKSKSIKVASELVNTADKEFNRLNRMRIAKAKSKLQPLIRKLLYMIDIENAVRQIDEAYDNINSIDNDQKIDIKVDLSDTTERGKQYIERHIGKILYKLASKIDLNHQLIIQYYFKGDDGERSPAHSAEKVITRTLNENNVNALLSQLKKEHLISDLEAEHAGVIEQDYDMFPDKLRKLTKIVVKNLNSKKVKDDVDVNGLLDKGLTMDEINIIRQHRQANTKKTNQVVEGSFWKYQSLLPIDLTRYQIINELNEENVKLIAINSCLIHAMIQAGVDDETIKEAKLIIKTRTMPQSCLSDISILLGVDFKLTVVYLDSDFNRTNTHNKILSYSCGRTPKYIIDLILLNGHYMLNEKVPITTYYIEHYNDIKDVVPLEDQPKVCYIKGKRYKLTNDKTSIVNILIAMFKNNYFKPIMLDTILSFKFLHQFNLVSYDTLEYDVDSCCKLIARKEKSKEITYSNYIYADFEASTDGEAHEAYMICAKDNKGKFIKTFWGNNSAVEFLDALPNNSLVYFHNLSYDINFIVKYATIVNQPIMKNGRVLSMTIKYDMPSSKSDNKIFRKTITFKDSYSVINVSIQMFPSMFNLKSGDKEVFPYEYYSKSLLKDNNRVGNIEDACKYIKPNDVEHFKNNINKIPRCKLNDKEFDLMVYSKYYCMQDVNILLQGFEKFRSDLLNEYGLDAYDYLSNSSIANAYMEKNCYEKNGNLYLLAGKPRDFISKCIQGGRCMTRDNVKQYFSSAGQSVSDFDAVSLYPSAIHRLYTLEGTPKVLTDNMLSTEYLLNHLFKDDQITPTSERYISGFFALVHIDSIGIERHMPLIVVDPEINPELRPAHSTAGAALPGRSSNTCCYMYVDHITFQDLIEFQQCKLTVIKGYYFDGNRDISIRKVIEQLFNHRLKYKKEGNPLQNIIKIILNSVYGKCLLKPIDKQTYIKNEAETAKFLIRNYNRVDTIETLYGSNSSIIKLMKPIDKHFNFVTLGVNILSMSKRIMNEVFCTAEDNNIKIFYQDTDSGHFLTHELKQLATLFEAKYNRPLIGTSLGQFHSDFAEVVKGKTSYAVQSVFVGKKSYIDQLKAEDSSDIAFHCRMKGITQEVISIVANELHPNSVQCMYDKAKGLHVPIGSYSDCSTFSVMELYKDLYNGKKISFDLCKGSNPCFDRKNNFSVVTKTSFIRELQFN